MLQASIVMKTPGRFTWKNTIDGQKHEAVIFSDNLHVGRQEIVVQNGTHRITAKTELKEEGHQIDKKVNCRIYDCMNEPLAFSYQYNQNSDEILKMTDFDKVALYHKLQT